MGELEDRISSRIARVIDNRLQRERADFIWWFLAAVVIGIGGVGLIVLVWGCL